MSGSVAKVIDWMEQGLVPERLMRAGIRSLVRGRARDLHPDNCELAQQTQHQFIDEMYASDVAPLPEFANEQHYEVPAAFYELVLGKHRKYSCCLWDQPTITTLDASENRALKVTCEHANLQDGQKVLELGCGWGSLTLWMAEHYPNSQITAVSNSSSQRQYIEQQLQARGFNNVRVITADMNDFNIDQTFDRVVSVEMFEHMRNWPELYQRIAGWLNAGGQFFMHVFCHRHVPYAFVDAGESDWMSRYFFTGGMMPSDDLPLHFQNHLKLDQRWRWNGQHYQKTAEAWADNMERHKAELMPLLQDVYGADDAKKWFVRWKLFFLACAELFGFEQGQQWWVSHYRFTKRAQPANGE